MPQQYEYKIVPAPLKGQKSKGVRGRDAKFAHALSLVMNELGSEGWEYVRADTLPCEERTGITSKTTHYLNMLVFRRLTSESDTSSQPADAAAFAALVAHAEALRPLLTSAPVAAPSKAAWAGFEDVEDVTPIEPEHEADMNGVIDLLAARRSRDTSDERPESSAAEENVEHHHTAAE